jgi:predicted ester cyclase
VNAANKLRDIATKATAQSTEEVARAYFERVTARDPDGMMEFWEPGGIGHIHGVAELRAPDTYREWFSKLFSAFPDLHFEVIDVVADETRAAVRWKIDANFNGSVPFEGILPTGARAEVEGVDLLTIRDGKIVSLEAYMNGMELARQLGALPPQASVAERGMFGLLNLRTRAARALRHS